MAEWVSHLIIADRVLERLPWLKKHEFCVGSIAPDCNIPNADWTDFTPPRQVTHWMRDDRKTASDCSVFRDEYIVKRIKAVQSEEELSFLYGYYAHLITDAEFQRFSRDEARVASAWKWIRAFSEFRDRSIDMAETWDSIKILFPDRKDRIMDFYTIEREYLGDHPESGYFTEIHGLETFPDYIDYLPSGAIPAKVKQMYYMPALEGGKYPFVIFSREECAGFFSRTVELVTDAIEETSNILKEIR